METIEWTTAPSAPRHASTIHVSLADSGGWLVTVERDGQALAAEHCDDWHRVERRVAALRSGITTPVARSVAAVLLIVLINTGPLAAQEVRAPLLPEPRLITSAVELVTGFKGDEASGPKDGFYAHTGQMISTKHAARVRPDVEHALGQKGVTYDLRRSSPTELMYEVTCRSARRSGR